MCFTVPIAGRGWQGRSLPGSQYSCKSDIIFMWEQVCSSEEVACGSVRSTAGDGGFSDTRTTHRLYSSFKGTYRYCQWLLESFDLGSLCWLTFGGKSTGWWEISSCLDYMPKTWSLKEEASKYMSNN